MTVSLESYHSVKRRLVMSFLKNFIDYCQEKNAVFAEYFQEIYFTGSYFEGLRVKDATEFDTLFIFKLPFDENKFVIDEVDMPLSYATMLLQSAYRNESQSCPFFDEKGYLIIKKMLNWFQSLIDKYLKTTTVLYPGVRQIRPSSSGPARTVKILLDSVWISVDLVPVFAIDKVYLNKPSINDQSLISMEEFSSYLVPKPLKPELSCLLPPHVPELLWKIHFPKAEKLLFLKDKNLKQVIKLAKALRDKQDWPISSYLLKMVGMWMIIRYPNQDFKNHENIGSLFLLYLESLEHYLTEKHLGHVFFPEFNLLHSLSGHCLENLSARVKKIISQLKRDPTCAIHLFKIMDMPFSLFTPSFFKPS